MRRTRVTGSESDGERDACCVFCVCGGEGGDILTVMSYDRYMYLYLVPAQHIAVRRWRR